MEGPDDGSKDVQGDSSRLSSVFSRGDVMHREFALKYDVNNPFTYVASALDWQPLLNTLHATWTRDVHAVSGCDRRRFRCEG